MWSEHIVFQTPFFNQYFCFFQGIEKFAIEQFISQFAIKAFIVAVISRRNLLESIYDKGPGGIPGAEFTETGGILEFLERRPVLEPVRVVGIPEKDCARRSLIHVQRGYRTMHAQIERIEAGRLPEPDV